MDEKFRGCPEILDAFEEAGRYFAVIRLEKQGEQRCFRFGVTQDGYVSLKRILQTRPFDQMPGLRRRYYFLPSPHRLDNGQVMMGIRIEQGNDGQNIGAEGPIELAANLVWFSQLDDWGEAEHLAVPDPRLS